MLFNEHLWAVYRMAHRHESIRALLLYDFESNEETEMSYKFIIISPNPTTFFVDLSWIEEIDQVWHIEKEHLFYEQSEIYFNCCVIFKSGWSSQFIFIKNQQPKYFFKYHQLIVFIDRDEMIKSEQIRIAAITYGQWQDPPTENRFKELSRDFYEGILQVSRLIKNQQLTLARQFLESNIEQPIIYLVQWLSYFGQYFYEKELKKIEGVIHYPSKSKELLTLDQLALYLDVGDYLLLLYSKSMNYRFDNQQIIVLKDYIQLIFESERDVSNSNKFAMIRVN